MNYNNILLPAIAVLYNIGVKNMYRHYMILVVLLFHLHVPIMIYDSCNYFLVKCRYSLGLFGQTIGAILSTNIFLR